MDDEYSIKAFKITNIEDFFKSITDEAFMGSAMFVGKTFFKRTKKDMKVFKKLVVDKKSSLIPPDEQIIKEIENYVFSLNESGDDVYIFPKDMEAIIAKISNEISYKIMSSLTDASILELCYSSQTNDFIWRIKK